MKRNNKRFYGTSVIAGLLFFLIVVIFACKKSSTDNQSPGTNEVFMQSISFNPSSITITHGTTITWTNKDNVSHTVTANDASFDSKSLSPGSTFTHTFSSAGTVNYHCNIHSGMNGVVVVQ